MSEPTLVEIIIQYLRVAGAYWWVLLPGGVMALPDTIKWHHPTKEIRFPFWVRLSIAIACIFSAQFLAYRNQTLNLATVVEEKRQQSITINSSREEIEILKQKLNDSEKSGRRIVVTSPVSSPSVLPNLTMEMLSGLLSNEAKSLVELRSAWGYQDHVLAEVFFDKARRPRLTKEQRQQISNEETFQRQQRRQQYFSDLKESAVLADSLRTEMIKRLKAARPSYFSSETDNMAAGWLVRLFRARSVATFQWKNLLTI